MSANLCEFCKKPNLVNKENGIVIKYKTEGMDTQAFLHKYCAAEWCRRLPQTISIRIVPIQ